MSSKKDYLSVRFGQDVYHDEPYLGKPADFYNRDDVKKKALDILLSPQTRRAVWLIGERRAGKTSILRLLLDKCRAQEGYIAFEVPWQAIHSPASFYSEFFQALDNASNIQRERKNASTPDSEVHDWQTFWSAFQTKKQELPGKILIVGIDEFDSILSEQKDENSRREITSLVFRLVEDTNVKTILATVARPDRIEYIKASPLVARSEPIDLHPFDDKNLSALVEDFVSHCPKSDVEQICYLSGTWPYYAKAILHHLLQLDEGIDQRLKRAREAAVKSISPTCEHLYRHHWSAEERRALLLLAKKGLLRREEFEHLDTALRTAFGQLIERGYLLVEDQQYRFRVQLIGDWFQNWIHRELEEENLGVNRLLKNLERDLDPWRREPGEIPIKVTVEEMRRRGF